MGGKYGWEGAGPVSDEEINDWKVPSEHQNDE